MNDETKRRHPNVVNADELEPMDNAHGDKFAAKISGLGRAAGGQGVGRNLFEVPAGRTAFPCHYHCANEEALYVLGGTGTLRIGEAKVALRPGDWINIPAHTRHRVESTDANEPSVWLAVRYED